MPTDNAHKTLILALRTEIDRLYDRAGDPGSSPFRSKYDEVATLWEKLRDLTHGSNSGDIADFFDAIGSGVIGAQKRLDRASEEYVRSSLSVRTEDAEDGQPAMNTLPANASMFRIPRVTAELKCSLEKGHEKKLNLVFYSDRNDVRELHQQTISLEVVAVPVPPDYLNQLTSRASTKTEPETESETEPEAQDEGRDAASKGPQIFSMDSDGVEGQSPQSGAAQPMMLSLSDAEDQKESDRIPIIQTAAKAQSLSAVTISSWLDQARSDVDDRRAVRDLLEKLLEKADLKQLVAPDLSEVQRRLLPAWERALVCTDGHNTRFVLLAVTDKRPRLLLWQLVLRPASLRLLYKLPKQQAINQELLRLQRFVAALGDSQAASGRTDG